jgi:hypothetical protein
MERAERLHMEVIYNKGGGNAVYIRQNRSTSIAAHTSDINGGRTAYEAWAVEQGFRVTGRWTMINAMGTLGVDRITVTRD